ncbi:MAG: phosphoglycerate kinase, partial [Patescibacteria group bacterium]
QLQKEVENLSRVIDDPKRPLVLIISGAKMETKVPVVEQFLAKGDDILLGGCIANTFIAARGFDVGTSKYDETALEKAQELMLEAEKTEKADIHVPRDAVVASSTEDTAQKLDLPVEDIEGDMSILDIGKVTVERYRKTIEKAGTIVWNGPVGYYEVNRFSHATKRIAEAIAEATKKGAISIVGGGDTIDFHERYHYPLDAYTFVSTGGGAMLEFIGGKKLPALEALKR